MRASFAEMTTGRTKLVGHTNMQAPQTNFKSDGRATPMNYKMSKSCWTPLVSLNCRLVQGE